jgi:hypothetical protein
VRFFQLEDSEACPPSGSHRQPEHSSQRGLNLYLGALCIKAHEFKNSLGGNVLITSILLERWIGIFHRGPGGGVKAGTLGVGSLILISPIGFPVVLLIARRPGQNRDSQNWDITIKVGNGRGEAIQGLHSDKRDIIFQEDKTSNIDQVTLPGLFPPQYGRSAPIRQSASWRCLQTFLLGASPDAPG